MKRKLVQLSESHCGILIATPYGQPKKKNNKSYYHQQIKQYDIPREMVYMAGVPVVFGWYILAAGLAFMTSNGIIR